MRKFAKRALIVLVSLILLVSSLVGCSQKGETLMKLEKQKMSVNTYMLFLSRVKGTLSNASGFGSAATKNEFWDIVMDSDGSTTYNDYYCNMVLESAKTYLAAAQLFKEEGLKLSKETEDEIKETLDRLVETDGKGSKATLNSILADYGANYEVLKDAYTLESKVAQLRDHLYGADGEKISENLLEDYYQENYVKFKQVFLYTYEVLYEVDGNGDDIYYTDDGRIAYNTNRTKKTDADGNPVKDSNGDVIYVNRDGSVAYDTENGERQLRLDEDGYAMTRSYTEEELRKVSDMAQIIMENTVEGDEKVFDFMVEEYNEDVGMDEQPNGYYVTKDTDYASKEVIEALFDMDTGEIRKVRSEYGIHIVMKYSLDKGGYADKDNATFFSDKNGSYLFIDDLKNQLFEARLKPYTEEIKVNEDLLDSVDMKSVKENTLY